MPREMSLAASWHFISVGIRSFAGIRAAPGGAVKEHPYVRRGEAEFLTDFCRLDAEMLAHQEYLSGARGQIAQALLERGEELLVLERLLGPVLRRLAPVAARVEQRIQVFE